MRSFYLTERMSRRDLYYYGDEQVRHYMQRIREDLYRRAMNEIVRDPDHSNYYFKFIWSEMPCSVDMEMECRLTVHVAYTDRIATHINEISGTHSFAPIRNPFPTNPMANTVAEPEEQLERKCVL